jgi:hypothetical protein
MAVPDAAHMRRAIELSRQAGIVDKTGKCFGAVVVDAGGNVIGEGWVEYPSFWKVRGLAVARSHSNSRQCVQRVRAWRQHIHSGCDVPYTRSGCDVQLLRGCALARYRREVSSTTEQAHGRICIPPPQYSATPSLT